MTLRCVAFDFDGTLVDSNAIKREAFFSTTRDWPGAETYLREILAAPDAGTRHEIFAVLAAKYSGSGTDTDSLARHWIDTYSTYCEEAIVLAPEIKGAEACLRLLQQCGAQLYINSATPEPSLREIVSRRRLIQLFDAVYGAPHSKVENLERIHLHSRCSRQEIVFVGDSDADRLAASTFGCRFVAIGNGGVANLMEFSAYAIEGIRRGTV